MTTIGYIFLDVERDQLISLARQQRELEEYARGMGKVCEELLVEESFAGSSIFQERTEGKRLLDNVADGDSIITLKAMWVLGSPKQALALLDTLKAKGVSLFCVDLDGDLVHETERRLVVSQGIAPLVRKICEALTVNHDTMGHSAAIRAGKARRKEEGKYLGGPVPYGFQVSGDGRLCQNNKQQSIIDEMVSLKEDRWSYRDIAKKMKAQHGLKFSHEGIRRILLKNRKVRSGQE